MIVYLEITPRWPVDATPIRVCSTADRRAQSWDGEIWAAALSDPGSLSQSLFSGDIGASIDSATGPIVLSAKRLIASYPDAETVRWESASYRMWAGSFSPSVSPAYPDHGPLGLSVSQVSKGKVVRFEAQDGAIKLSLDPAGEAGDTKVLDLEYAGTTGAEGGADRKGTLKPWVFGVALNVEPVLIDEDNSVYQFSGYGPIKAVDALYERGASFGAAIDDYADYAALVAADIPAGRWGTCLAQGMIRLGAPQYGVITGDVQGDYADGILRRKPGAILQRIAAQRSISTDTIDTDSLDAIDDFAATLPAGGNINLVISDQIGFLDLARRICAPFNAQAGYSLMGKLFACRVAVGTPTFTIHSQGKRLPVVSDFVEADTPPPFKRIVMSGNISWRVHDLANDVAFYATPKERGIYDDAETYREGDIVSIADGSRWIYVNPTATAGNDPADASAYWERMSAAATGPQGPAGEDGAPGAPGADRFTHYAYADAPDGSFNFTTGSPGDRTYQGVRYNQTSATESTNPADYDWSPYVGPPNFGLAAFNSNSVVAGNKLIKVSGGSAWNASIHSTESFKGGASVSAIIDDATKSFMIGLNSDPTTDASYESIDFAIYVYAGNDIQAYEDGAPVAGMGFTQPANGDVITVTYNDKSVVYSKNGVPFHTNNSPASGLTLFLDTSINDVGQVGRILSFTAAGPAGEDGDPGIDGRTIDLSAAAISFAAYDDGSLKTGEISKTSKASFLSGGTDVSASTTWTIEEENGCDASISSSGLVTFSSVSASGSVKLRGIYSGTTIDKTIATTVVPDPAPPAAPTSQSTNIANGSYSSASFPASPTGGILTVSTDSGGDMRVKVNFQYGVQDGGSTPSLRSLTLAGQLFYRLAGSGGAWTAWLGSESGGTTATAVINPDGELTTATGAISINNTKTGLSANTAYEIWFGFRKTGGTSGAVGIPGYQLITAEVP